MPIQKSRNIKQLIERCIFKNKRTRGRVVGDNILDKELQVRNIRAVDIVVLDDNEVAHKASIRGLLNGDETVALANLGLCRLIWVLFFWVCFSHSRFM